MPAGELRRAVVVFHGHGNHWLAPLLNPGFRHVFAVIEAGAYWVRLDPRIGTPEIDVLADADFDIAAFYREQEGFTVVETEVHPDVVPIGPVMLANCVGAVKAVLGLRAPLIITPHQLYRRLAKC